MVGTTYDLIFGLIPRITLQIALGLFNEQLLVTPTVIADVASELEPVVVAGPSDVVGRLAQTAKFVLVDAVVVKGIATESRPWME